MARTTEKCDSTSGILRYDLSRNATYVSEGLFGEESGISEDVLMALSRWDPTQFYNIYIVNKIDGWDYFVPGSGILGYAYFPKTNNNQYGTFLLSATVSTTDVALAHGFGHSIGLYHTFQGGGYFPSCPPSESNCATAGDRVCDTERYFYSFGACPSNSDINSCTGVNYQGTQYNVMSYGFCANRMTNGQVERALFEMKNFRSSLMYSNKGIYPAFASDTVTVIDATCTPPNSGTPDTDGPYNIQFGGIEFFSARALGDNYFYKDHTLSFCRSYPVVGHLEVGATDTFKVSLGYENYLKIYIDYNNNGTFESTENVFSSVGRLGVGAHNIPVVLPEDAVINQPLRVRFMATNNNVTNPCGSLEYGQAEDFALIISEPLSIYVNGFSVNPINCGNVIRWNVMDLQGIYSIDLEESLDGISFYLIKSFDSKDLNINNEFFASIANSKTQYYRLNILQSNGLRTFGKVININN